MSNNTALCIKNASLILNTSANSICWNSLEFSGPISEFNHLISFWWKPQFLLWNKQKKISLIRVSSVICLELCTRKTFDNFPPKFKLKLLNSFNTFFNSLIWTTSSIFLSRRAKTHTNKINFVVKFKKKKLKRFKRKKLDFKSRLYIQSNQHRFQFSPKNHRVNKARRITEWAKHFSDPEQKHMISTICVF